MKRGGTKFKFNKQIGLFIRYFRVGGSEGCMIEWCISSIFLAPKPFMARMTIFKPLLLPMGWPKMPMLSLKKSIGIARKS